MNAKSFFACLVTVALALGAAHIAQASEPSEHMKPCSVDQTKAANKALAGAKSAIGKAIKSIKTPSQADLKRQQKWFGALASDSAQKVQKSYEGALVRATFSQFWCPLRNDLTFKWAVGDKAAVHPNALGAIFLTPEFFELPLSSADSQLGTFVHELSHLAGVGLRPEEYGTTKAIALALSDPKRASNNSDNYQYYIEDLLFKLP